MATPTVQVKVTEEQERAILLYATSAHSLLLNQFSLRTNLEEIDRYYMREGDYTEANQRNQLASRSGDKSKIQNVTVPIVMPAVRAALDYMSNVFLTGYPVFGVSGDPENEDAALQMETIIGENAISGGWVRQLMMFFIDGLKYNIHGVELEWKQRTVANIENQPTAPNGAGVKNVLWNGNSLRRLDMYNTFFDPRVRPSEIHSMGEYAGYIEMYSRVQMKQFINDLFGTVSPALAIKALNSNSSGTIMGASSGTPFAYYRPIINPNALMQNAGGGFDWTAWVSGVTQKGPSQIRYSNVYEITTMYARIIPSDFGFSVPAANTPQVWKFRIVNGSVVLCAEKMSNAHNWIPLFFGQPLEDGLDYQTKSFASNITDMQDVASAMWNGYLASKRRLVGDRVLFDPLRVREKDINSTNPAAKIPVRPSAYGKPVSEAVYQFPFRDEQTQTLIQGADIVAKFADKVNGQNPAQSGQFVKGNKTKQEWDDTMGGAEGGNQLMALATESQVFIPLKEAIKLNVLQYQEPAVLFNRDKNSNVTIDPVSLRTAAVHFKISDGLVPTDKQMDTDEFQTALQTLGSSPQIASAYNIGPLFTYIMKMRGADLRPFEKSQLQLQYEQQIQQWQMAAQNAAKTGAAFSSPQPQPSPALQQEMAGAQQQPPQAAPSTTFPPSPTSRALEATQGMTPASANGPGNIGANKPSLTAVR